MASLSRSDLPEEIATAIEELAFAYYSHGLGVGDGTLHQIEPRRSAEARSALTATILSRLGEAEAGRDAAQGAPFGTGYSRAEPSGLGPEAEYPSRGWQPIATAPKDGSFILLWSGIVMRAGWWFEDDEVWRLGGDTILRAPTHWMPLPTPPAQETEAEGQDAKGGLVHEGSVAEGHAPALTEAGRLAIKDA